LNEESLPYSSLSVLRRWDLAAAWRKPRNGNIASDFEFHHGAEKRRQDAGATNAFSAGNVFGVAARLALEDA
jgi:hypothetical protein